MQAKIFINTHTHRAYYYTQHTNKKKKTGILNKKITFGGGGSKEIILQRYEEIIGTASETISNILLA